MSWYDSLKGTVVGMFRVVISSSAMPSRCFMSSLRVAILQSLVWKWDRPCLQCVCEN